MSTCGGSGAAPPRPRSSARRSGRGWGGTRRCAGSAAGSAGPIPPVEIQWRTRPIPAPACTLEWGILRRSWAQPQQVADVTPRRAWWPLPRVCALRSRLWLSSWPVLPPVLAPRRNPTPELRVRQAQFAWCVAESPCVETLRSAPRCRGRVPSLVPRILADGAATQLLPSLDLLEGARILGLLQHPGARFAHELLPLEAVPPAVQADVPSVFLGVGMQDVVVASVPPLPDPADDDGFAPSFPGHHPIVYGLSPGLSLHDSLTMTLLACGDAACLEQWMHLYPPPSQATARCGPQVGISPPCKFLIGPPRTLSRVWGSPTRANLCLLCSPPGVADPPPSAPHPGWSTGFSALPGGVQAWRRTALAGAARARFSWPQRSPGRQPRGFPACRLRRSSRSPAFLAMGPERERERGRERWLGFRNRNLWRTSKEVARPKSSGDSTLGGPRDQLYDVKRYKII